jgi:phage N-6-adenine-methyltransferase
MGLSRYRARNHPQQVRTRGVDDAVDNRVTPLNWFSDVHLRFNFTLDVAASASNHKLPRYFDIATNGLSQPWVGERVWCNPPFSDITPWVQKAWIETQSAPVIVMLVPANRTEQAWWHQYIEPYRDRAGSPLRVEFIRHRLRFIAAGNSDVQANERPPFGVCLLIWEWPAVVGATIAAVGLRASATQPTLMFDDGLPA